MFRYASLVALQIAALAIGPVVSASASASTYDRRPTDLPRSSDIREGRFLLAPQAFILFCRDNPDECGAESTQAARLNAAALEELQTVNSAVNRTVMPVSLRGPDVWTLNRHKGHCAIFAVQKRHDLIAAGWPAATLSLAMVYTGSGENHLVLVARTDRGAFVLDNLRDRILPWDATGYQFAKIQSIENPNFWVSISGSRPVTATLTARSAAKI